MKKIFILLFVTAFNLCGYAQFKAFKLDDSSLLRFIPSYMTKGGKQIVYSCDFGSSKFTVYDDDFNIVKQYAPPSNALSYQVREIKYTKLIDPTTKEVLSDWTIESDIIQDNSGGNGGWISILICSEENIASGMTLNLTQTLFDEDEEFEFLRPKNDVIPITTKTEDYISEHSSGDNIDSQYSPEEWWREYGAESYESIWDNEKQKDVYKLIKFERYGGLYFSAVEVVNLDGVVKNTLEGIKGGGYTGYHVNGDFYIRHDNSNNIYKLNSHKLPETNVRGVNYDLNRDGHVNVADHVELSNKILNQNK